MKKIFFTIAAALIFASFELAQVPTATLIKIVKAEDARAYDKTLEDLMKSPNSAVQIRAALAAGRIGDDKAVPVLTALLEKEQSEQVSAIAAFALGEIESIKAADAILKFLAQTDAAVPKAETRAAASVPGLRARLVEAAGKIAAANAKDEKSKALGEAILYTLKTQEKLGSQRNRDVVLLALMAALRAKPTDADAAVGKFLTDPDVRIRADAANALARLRAKNTNEALRQMLVHETDPVARANAARALGAAEDKEAFNLLLTAATEDEDSRVRVSAIGSLGSLKDAKAFDKLHLRTGQLLIDLKKPRVGNLTHRSELLEIATAFGRILENTNDERAVRFLNTLRQADRYMSPESEIALARVAPEKYINEVKAAAFGYSDPWVASAYGHGIGVLSDSKNEELRVRAAEKLAKYVAELATGVKDADDAKMAMAMPHLIRSIAAFKPENLEEVLRELLTNEDEFIRATAAELLAERPSSKENVSALKTAFSKALLADKIYNDAQLAILDALYKLDKKESVGTLLVALSAPDYLVRKKAFELLADKELQKDFPGIPTSLENARAKHKDQVLQYSPPSVTKLGQVLNTDADYRRALSRKNGTVKAVLTTQKGRFTIDLTPEEAPLTVDNFIKLAKSRYFNGVEVHRVVPNFVMQDGDPRGDGNGGPGWSIRCEVNMLPYDRGAVGMALSGKDTGGSQWFVTHSPQPHLDGGYTVFGHVNETDMKVVDNIVRGDKVISVKIIEGNSPQRAPRTQSK